MTRPDADKSKEQCEDCRYCFLDVATGIIACHKNAPVATVEQPRGDCPMSSDFSRTLWPIVDQDDWCGEFKAKEPDYPNWIDMNWSVRTRNVLRGNGVGSVKALIEHSSDELLEFRKFGFHCLYEVESNLAKYELSLRKSNFRN